MNQRIPKTVPPHAPYEMLLIKDKYQVGDLEIDCVEHSTVSIKVKKPQKTRVPFVDDDMEIENAHVGRGFRREKHVSEPSGPIKDKFTWKARWKKVFCMHVEIHEENYEGYKKRKMIIPNQKNII